MSKRMEQHEAVKWIDNTKKSWHVWLRRSEPKGGMGVSEGFWFTAVITHSTGPPARSTKSVLRIKVRWSFMIHMYRARASRTQTTPCQPIEAGVTSARHHARLMRPTNAAHISRCVHCSVTGMGLLICNGVKRMVLLLVWKRKEWACMVGSTIDRAFFLLPGTRGPAPSLHPFNAKSFQR